jgi:hypothetical protein
MSDQIFNRAELREKAFAALREAPGPLSSGQVAAACGVPIWAIEHALEDAYQEKEVTFAAGVGWVLLTVAEKRTSTNDEQQALVG